MTRVTAPRSQVSRHLVPDRKWRDRVIALGAGAVVLGFFGYAVFSLGHQANSAGGIEGVIASKEFIARAETQITIGQAGMQTRQTKGDYVLHVKVPRENGRVYDIYVDARVYAEERAGERYYFVRPKE